MGHSQSYDLRNPETGEKTPVRGVRRVSREHQTDGQLSTESAEPYDYREEELRERIRKEQLEKREKELGTMRISKHESREPIIDAYRSSHSPQQAVYNEFNHYDSLKHPSPAHPNTYLTLNRRAEINEGRRVSIPTATTRYDQVPIDPSPQLPRRHEIPVTTSDHPYREIPIRQETPDYPNRTSVYNGRVSPLPRQEEVDPHPMPRYIPPMSPRYDRIPNGTHYSKTTKTTTYTISRGGIPKYEEVPVPDPVVLRKHVPISPKPKPYYYSSTSNIPKYDEVPDSPRNSVRPRPASTYSYASPLPKYTDVPISPRPSSTYSKASKLPKYNEIPTRYSRSTEVYKETLINPSGYHTVSRSSKLPKYDEVPRSTLYSRASSSSKYEEAPRSPSLHSLRIRTYDEVPIQTSPRSITPVYVPPSNRVRIVPVQTFPPVPKPKIHLTPLQPEVSKEPLNQSVHKTAYRTQAIPVRVESDSSRSESPANVVYSFSSSKQKVQSPPCSVMSRETPIYRTVVKQQASSPKTFKINSTQTGKEVSRNQSVDRHRSQPMDKITMTSIYRSAVVKKNISSPSDPKPSPRRVEKMYVTKLQKDIRWVPLSQYVFRPIYSSSSDDDASVVSVTPIHSPSPPRTPSPKLYLTTREKEVSQVPLSRYVNRRSPYDEPPSPVERIVVPVTKSTPPPPSPTPPKIYLTRLHPEVPKTPLDDHVARPIRRTPINSTPPSPVSRTVVSPRSNTPPTSPEIYLTKLHPEIPRCPLDDHVARPIRDIYSNPPSPVAPPTILTPSPPPTPPKIHVTRRESDIRKTPLSHYVGSEPYYGPPLVENKKSAPSPPSVELMGYESDLRKTPLGNYVNRTTSYSPTPSDVTIVSRQTPPPPQKIHRTALEKEVRKTPIGHYVNRDPVQKTPEPTRNVVSPITSRHHSCSRQLHFTSLEEEARGTPLGHYVKKEPICSTPEPIIIGKTASPVYAKSNNSTPVVSRTVTPISRTNSQVSSHRSSPILPSKLPLTRRDSDISSHPLGRFESRSVTPILVENSLPVEKPRRSLDYNSKSSTKMPARLHFTKRHEEVPRVPLASKPSNPTHRSPVYDQVPLSIGTQTLPYEPVVSPKSRRRYTKVGSEVSVVPCCLRPVYTRPSTIISIYSVPIGESPTHLSEIHAEKRMIVGIDEMQKPENVTYVTVATSSIHGSEEPLHRHPEVGRHPVYVVPSQYCYERVPLATKSKQIHSSRRSSEDVAKILTPPQRCNVENCTHVEVHDETPVVARRRISQDVVRDKVVNKTISSFENNL
ncbi:hypothetical protein CRE_02066 [Caenorhabditis remanei]|uniref:Uncharacterized protein n=1 Tax=Caenorhabditis remanei TaxID=31234 RepID=E3LH55_CAERE|nr:hypothetical protein CRE_02066 [Caenorhabditis remanei]